MTWIKCSTEMPKKGTMYAIMRKALHGPDLIRDIGYRVDDDYWYYKGSPGKFPNSDVDSYHELPVYPTEILP